MESIGNPLPTKSSCLNETTAAINILPGSSRSALVDVGDDTGSGWKGGGKKKQSGEIKNKSALKWEAKYNALVHYKETYGHTLVENRHPALGNWVSTQRRYYRAMKLGEKTPLSQGRITKLDDIGFIWDLSQDPRVATWNDRFEQLEDYKVEHGNCLVPFRYNKNAQLATWVSTQRNEYKLWKLGRQSRLDDSKVQRLDELGFVWQPPRGGARKRSANGVTKKPSSSSTTNDVDQRSDTGSEAPRNKKKHYKKVKRLKAEGEENNMNCIEMKNNRTVPWIKMYKEYVWYQDHNQNIEENKVLQEWYAMQKTEFLLWNQDRSKSTLGLDEVNLLESIGFTNDPTTTG